MPACAAAEPIVQPPRCMEDPRGNGLARSALCDLPGGPGAALGRASRPAPPLPAPRGAARRQAQHHRRPSDGRNHEQLRADLGHLAVVGDAVDASDEEQLVGRALRVPHAPLQGPVHDDGPDLRDAQVRGLSEHERRRPRDVGAREGRAAEGAGRRVIGRARGQDVRPRREEVDANANVAESGPFVAHPEAGGPGDGRNGQGVRAAGGGVVARVRHVRFPVVSRGDDDRDVRPRRGPDDPRLRRGAARSAAPQAHAKDGRPLARRGHVVDGLDDAGSAARAPIPEDLDRVDDRLLGDAVRLARDGPGAVRAVTVHVARAVRARVAVADPARDEVYLRDGAALELAVRRPDPCVQHIDVDAFAFEAEVVEGAVQAASAVDAVKAPEVLIHVLLQQPPP
eukprot:CAMPEP_0179260024 /NCGR_PEP_ID=MMETSP0797-20121207/26125_1 /TAXON_ID=47934 /ORGANISM="Dinophysis acuminata, Strain DAEP01" /LENGTH=396 /DNA_ID=CAMNT_0020968089 /DNA_START=58 /DNA_END=1244 /DNA_ORIENTATION=+